jgi:type IV pilus assembly protein PilC
MTRYTYVARDRSGKSAQGTIQANDEQELRRVLRSNDLYLTEIKSAAAANTEAKTGSSIFDPKPKLQDMVIAMRQLGSMIRAGMPLIEALQVVGSQSNKPALRNAFKDLERHVSEGQFLSAGMKKYPEIFTPLVLSLVEAGEMAGTLEHTLEVAAHQLNREDEFKRKVSAATLYPKLVLLACAGTIAAMLVLVVPTFAEVYKSLKADLPAPTKLLMALSDVVLKGWWIVLLIGLALAYAYKRYCATPGGRRRVDIITLKIPVLGPLMRKIAIARFVQTLAGALSGGVPILQSLTISGATAGNTVIVEAVNTATLAVRDGSQMATELDRTQQFPMMVTRMIAAGEATGNVDAMLTEINEFYERDIEYSVDKFARMIEPAMTVVVGLIVCLILLALYMPIFSLGKAFQGAK